MSSNYEKSIAAEFEKLDCTRFKVNQSQHRIFICGGPVDVTKPIPPSFRNRFISYAASKNSHIEESIILAESFKDYFKENAYSDLLVFEDEIANLSSLILIFLESPGSLVELGMFCSRPQFYRKLLIVAPQEKTESEDSFIYLGPLEHISRKESSSVMIYPWPRDDVEKYDVSHLDDLLLGVVDKLGMISKEVKFNSENSGHIALLIHEIIRVSYPIIVSEIELAMLALGINVSQADINRHLYLLIKLGYVKSQHYSSYKYYYSSTPSYKSINYGKDRHGRVVESNSIELRINQSYTTDRDDSSRKRIAAKKLIIQKMESDNANI